MAETETANRAILGRLNAMPQFHPASCTLFTDWRLEPGDIVSVASGDETYSVPVFSLDLEWKGTTQAEVQSTGSEKRPPLSELKRRSYAAGKKEEEQQTEIDQVIYRTDFTKTDEGIGLLASAVGVKIDQATGKPAVNPTTGKYEFDANGASLTGQINIQAGAISAEIVQARGDSQTLRAALDLKTDSAKLSAVMDNNGAVTAASVVAAVNATTGDSEVHIDGDHIYISGTAKLSGQVVVDDGSLRVKTALLVSGSTNGDVSINNGTIVAKTHQVRANGSLVFVGTGTGEHYDLTTSNVPNMHVSAAVANDTLTVSKLGGGSAFTIQKSGNNLLISDGTTTINFSKATTLTGEWGSGASAGTYTVTASPQGNTHSVSPGLRLNGGSPPVANFSAEMTDATQNPPTVQKSTYGYLILDEDGVDSTVKVNTESDGSGVNVASVDVSDVYDAGVAAAGGSAWLFYADAVGTTDEGTLASDSYICVGYQDEDGNWVKKTDTTWKTPSSTAVSPNIQGAWDGSGTYNITSTPAAGSGSKLTVTPGLRLNGNGGTSFSAEMLNDDSSPTVEKTVTGYLHQNGSIVGVYKTYDSQQETYSDIIAQITVSASGSYASGWAAARAKVDWPAELSSSSALQNSMTVKVPSDTVDAQTSMAFRIDLGDGLTWKSSSSGQSPSGTALNSLSSMINSHRNDRGYIEFYAEICNNADSSKNYSRRKYYITIGSA